MYVLFLFFFKYLSVCIFKKKSIEYIYALFEYLFNNTFIY